MIAVPLTERIETEGSLTKERWPGMLAFGMADAEDIKGRSRYPVIGYTDKGRIERGRLQTFIDQGKRRRRGSVGEGPKCK